MTNLPQEEPPSKSQRKRDHSALQALGETLIGLNAGQLARIPLEDSIREAVVDGRPMRKNALRRQVRYLGKLLANTDVEPIREALAALEQSSAREVALLKRCERWRERLLESQPGALAEVIDAFPQVDRQRLRHLVVNAQKERDESRSPRAARELFRLLRTLEGEAQDARAADAGTSTPDSDDAR